MDSEEKEKICELKELVQDVLESGSLPAYMSSDIALHRFIVGDKGDVDAAAAAYREMAKWRQENEIKLIAAEVSEKPLKQSSFPHYEAVKAAGMESPWYHSGNTNSEGHIVHLEVVGRSDMTQLFASVPYDNIFQHFVGFFETRARILDQESNKMDKVIKTYQIRDLSNFGLHLLSHARALSTLGSLLKIGTTYYPECCEKAVFVNTPTTFYATWSVIKPMLKEKTQKKVIFLNQEYHRELLKVLPVDVLHKLDLLIHNDTNQHYEDLKPDEAHAIERSVFIPARGTFELFIYVDKAKRRKANIRLLEYAKTATCTLLVHEEEDVKELNLEEDSLETVENEKDAVLRFVFPAQVDNEMAYLCIKVENPDSWLQSQELKYTVDFVSE